MIINANGKSAKDGVNGKDGADGITPHIGDNGNWWIGETDTGVKASSDGLQQQAEIHYYTIDVDGNSDSYSGGWIDLSTHWSYMCSPSGIAYHDGTGYIDEQNDLIFVDLYIPNIDARPELEEAFSKVFRIDFYGNRASYNVYVFASEKPAVSFQIKIAVLKGARMS